MTNENDIQDRNILTDEKMDERAAEYSKSEDVIEVQGVMTEFLDLNLGEEKYLIEMNFVHEILPVDNISRIPNQPEFMLGTMNVRGDIIIIFDLALFLNKPKTNINEDTRIVFLVTGNDISGFPVDDISEVVKIDTGFCQNTISTIDKNVTSLIKGLFNINDNHFIWLDIERAVTELENKLSHVWKK